MNCIQEASCTGFNCYYSILHNNFAARNGTGTFTLKRQTFSLFCYTIIHQLLHIIYKLFHILSHDQIPFLLCQVGMVINIIYKQGEVSLLT